MSASLVFPLGPKDLLHARFQVKSYDNYSTWLETFPKDLFESRIARIQALTYKMYPSPFWDYMIIWALVTSVLAVGIFSITQQVIQPYSITNVSSLSAPAAFFLLLIYRRRTVPATVRRWEARTEALLKSFTLDDHSAYSLRWSLTETTWTLADYMSCRGRALRLARTEDVDPLPLYRSFVSFEMPPDYPVTPGHEPPPYILPDTPDIPPSSEMLQVPSSGLRPNIPSSSSSSSLRTLQRPEPRLPETAHHVVHLHQDAAL
jgi:hypothetical protein